MLFLEMLACLKVVFVGCIDGNNEMCRCILGLQIVWWLLYIQGTMESTLKKSNDKKHGKRKIQQIWTVRYLFTQASDMVCSSKYWSTQVSYIISFVWKKKLV